VKYWEKVKIKLVDKFPNHSLWSEDNAWERRAKFTIEDNSSRLDLILGHDNTEPKTKAMYMKTRPFATRYEDRSKEKGKDLYSVLESIMHEGGERECADRLQLLLVYYGVGRGGEHKFLRLDECHWDRLYELVETEWPQKKVVVKSLSTLSSCPPNAIFEEQRDCFEADVFHAFACYFAAEDGLHRYPHQDPQVIKFLFPHLHAIRDETVARNLRTLLKKHCHESIKKHTSAKSLRKGANTFLSKHLQVTEKQRLARGGWAARNSSETPAYFEITPEIVTPSMFALAGWPNVMANNLPMRITIQMREADSRIDEFHKNLYTIDHEQFVRGKVTYELFLEPFLWTCTAAAVLYFPIMYRKYGPTNKMISKMLQAGAVASLLGKGAVEVSTVLSQWSEQIKNDFEERNVHIDSADPNHLYPVINQMATIITKLQAAVNRIEEGQLKTGVQFNVTNASLQKLFDKLQWFTKRNSPSKQKPSPTSPAAESPRLVGNKRPRVESPTEEAALSGETDSVEVEADIKPDVNSILMSSMAQAPGNKLESMKGKSISASLAALHRNGHLANCGKKEDLLTLQPPFHIGHRDVSKWKACMEVVSLVITLEQQKKLFSKADSLPNNERLTQTKEIETACQTYVRTLTNTLVKGYVSGLGAAYIKYKNKQEASANTSTKGKLERITGIFTKKSS